ncbi:MAG: hypothetical protein ACR2KE_07040 [Candidatus Nanopelagicales bacterium]
MASVVYLHGMGGARPHWADPLQLPEGIACVAPQYADLIDHGSDVYARPPSIVAEESTASERAAYVDRQRELVRELEARGEAIPRGTAWPSFLPHPARLPDRLPLPRVLRSSIFGVDQVGRYLDDEGRRAAILLRVRAALDAAEPPVVVIAHSLGSVVMVDLLADLPRDIALLVTVGSPLGHEAVGRSISGSPFPYGRVGGWVNVVHLLDPVPFGRGLADRFPAAHDLYLPVTAGLGPGSILTGIARAATAHLDTTYLASDTVRAAVRYGLGSMAESS